MRASRIWLSSTVKAPAIETWGSELGEDAGLVDQVLEVVEDGGGVPDVVALPQQLELFWAPHAHPPPKLLKALVLVYELIHHVPQPPIWQLHITPNSSTSENSVTGISLASALVDQEFADGFCWVEHEE